MIKMKKIISLLLAFILVISAFSIAVSADAVDAVVVSELGDGYVIEGEQNAPYDFSDVTGTVTLNNAVIQNMGRSAIWVKDNSNITFVLEGQSVIKGDASVNCCGIQVEYGSRVTFTGEGALYVYGGNYGAGIGSYGTKLNIPYEERSLVGEITINSGNIFAYGGARGAGIGSGYHVNGNKITINGGVVYAYGKECGAGIGSGYGTSGGSDIEGAGGYDAGTIIINGGEVYASANAPAEGEEALLFDYSDLEGLNTRDKESFAAGIGGGYGACASHIEINGGKVVALGSCGGAGIGGGRGTSKSKNYKDIEDEHSYKLYIKIGGDADVTAMTGNRRTSETDGGAAAIGAGRGTHSVGDIIITDNAKVTAISPSVSNAIGISATEKWPLKDKGVEKPHTLSIEIGDGVELYAVSMGAHAVDTTAESLSISEDYFGSSDRWFFEEDAVAITDISNVKVESPKGEKTYAVPVGSVSLWANIVPPVTPVVKKASLGIVTPLAMAVRFEDGGVYYTGDTVEVEYGKDYHFQMCCVDWSTRDVNGEKKIHRAGEVFTPKHGIYSDDEYGLRGTVVFTVRLSESKSERSYDPETKTFVIPAGDPVLRTDVNKCFMAYRFQFEKGDYNKQTGIDKVVYDTGKEHVNTLDDFQYNKPLEFLSVNLPLGSTIRVKAYKNYELIDEADVFVSIDEENPDLCYKDYFWPY